MKALRLISNGVLLVRSKKKLGEEGNINLSCKIEMLNAY